MNAAAFDRTETAVAFGSASRPPIVRLDGVAKSYRGQKTMALRPTNLDVMPGEFISLLGPSGSGKTTTLRLIGGFEAPDSGRIWLDGTDVTNYAAHKRDLNTVFQNYALFPHMSVAQNVSYPLETRKTARNERASRIAEAISMVEMTGFEARLPHELSGGQRQRVALARALVGRPKVLLLDEPLGALDLRLRVQMQSVLTRLQRETGITFIYVTHDHGEALSMSDRVAVMTTGGISQVGSPRDIYYQPANRFVAGFIGTANVIDGASSVDGNVFENTDIRLLLPNRVKPGVTGVAIRSEAIEALPEGAAPLGENVFTALIEDCVFQGEVTELRCRVGGTRLILRGSELSRSAFTKGRSVVLRIGRASIVPLHD